MTFVRVGKLIDGVTDAPIVDAVIELSGDKITRVASWREVAGRLPTGDVLDLSDFFVLPGFIDAHTHMTLFADGRPYEEVARESDEMMLLAGVSNLRRHLYAGVTTARDNGSRNSLGFVLKEAVARGFVEGPRLLVSGRPVTKPKGHFFWCNGEADGPDAVRGAVARLVAEGADHIKIMASGGGTVGTDPRLATYSVDELSAAIETAHSLDKLTTAHCRAVESMRRAVEARVDCMEHAEFLQPDGRMTFDAETADRLLAAGTFISPTLSAWHWDTVLRLRREMERGEGSADAAAQLGRLERDVEAVLENFAAMLAAGLGGRIVGGTDAGCFDVTFGHLDYSMELMVDGGMTEMEAIQACTSVAARAVGLESTVGRVAPGVIADLVVVANDPLADIRAVGDVAAVCQSGRWVMSQVPGLASAGA